MDNDQTILEKDPLIKLSKENKLGAFLHEGFWQCMDTNRDKDILDSFCKNNTPPWMELDSD